LVETKKQPPPPAKSLLPSAEQARVYHDVVGDGRFVQFPPELVEKQTSPRLCAVIITVPSPEQATGYNSPAIRLVFVHV